MTSLPGGAPPKVKYTRYPESGLQTAYAHVVTGLRSLTLPIYGSVFSDDVADMAARHVVDAVRTLPESKDLQERIRCVIEPQVRKAAGEVLVGFFTLQFAALAGWALYRTLKRP